MLNRILAICLISSLTSLGYGQAFDQRLIDYFGVDHLLHLQLEAPNVLEYHKYYLDNVTVVQTARGKDVSNFPDVSGIPVKSGLVAIVPIEDQITNNSFNPFLFDLGQNESSYNYYKIGSSGKILAILPRKIFYERYNVFRGALHE